MADATMTCSDPADRAGIVARVKRLALPFADAVAKRSQQHVDLLTSGMSREELIALAVIGYEAADLKVLRMVTEAPGDEGRPGAETLRKAHAQAYAYRAMDREVPDRIALFEREYNRQAKRSRRDRKAA